MQATSVATDGHGTCSVNGIGRTLSSTYSMAGRLRESLEETARLLEAFAREEQQEQSDVPDMETYRKCCRHLVAYMVIHMNTSVDFTRQMERVIEASRNNSSGIALQSLVAGNLWVRYNCSSSAGPSEVPTAAVPSTPAPRGPTVKMDTEVDGAVAVTPLAVANASVTGLRPTCSPHVDLTVSTPPIAGQSGKRQSMRGRLPTPEPKRARHTVARDLYGAGSLDDEVDDEEIEQESTKESETETEAEIEVCEYRNSRRQLHTASLQNDQSGDGIVWPCAGDNRSERTPAYKQRLKTAIQLVDAENCSPPPGMVCTLECARARMRMCETHRAQGGNAMPCHNGMCCVWREIDTHLVRCQNSQCEFKNVVGLRQTMHDIQQHELKLKATSNTLLAIKTATLDGGVAGHDNGSRRRVGSQLESKIKRLEDMCAKLEDAVLLHKDKERAFTVDLNALKIRSPYSETDESPSFLNHYATKRPRE